MAIQLRQSAVSIIDWVVVWLSGMVFLACAGGAGYVLHYGHSSARRAGSAFNYLWSARICFQLAAACLAACQILRLQVLWGPESVFFKGGDPSWPLSTTMCRVYVVVVFGLLEPVTLLLALFACVYSVQSKLAPPIVAGQPSATSASAPSGLFSSSRRKQVKGRAGGGSPAGSTAGGSEGRISAPGALQPNASHNASVTGLAAGGLQDGGSDGTPGQPGPGSSKRPSSIKHPNFNIVFFALGFTLPACTAQLVCALFTRIFDLDYSNVPLFRVMFSTYDTREVDQYCPAELQDEDGAGSVSVRCAWCVFPVLSTLVSGALVVAVLLALLVVTRRIANAAVSKVLTRRVKVMQVVVTATLLAAMACRGLTALFRPFDLGFELLRLGDVLFAYSAVVCLSWMLVWRPVRDAQIADVRLVQSAATKMVGLGPSGGSGMGAAPIGGGSLASGGFSAQQPWPKQHPPEHEWQRDDKGSAEAPHGSALSSAGPGAASGGTFWQNHPSVLAAQSAGSSSRGFAGEAPTTAGSISLPPLRSPHKTIVTGSRSGDTSQQPGHASSSSRAGGSATGLPPPGAAGGESGGARGPSASASAAAAGQAAPHPQHHHGHSSSWMQEPLSPLNAAARAQAEKQPLVNSVL